MSKFQSAYSALANLVQISEILLTKFSAPHCVTEERISLSPSSESIDSPPQKTHSFESNVSVSEISPFLKSPVKENSDILILN